MTNRDIKLIVSELKKYAHIANKPNSKNNIVIEDNEIRLIEKGEIIKKRKLEPVNIFLKADKTWYPKKNPYCSDDIKYSPIEADYSKYAVNWKTTYNKIDFPKFISVILFSLLEIGNIPSLYEFCQIYMMTYMEVIPEGYVETRKELYVDASVEDRKNIGNKLVCEKEPYFENKEIRFKEKYLPYVHVPVNEFTTEYICNRIYKVYGSIIRDIHSVIILSSCGANASYELYSDLKGADMLIEKIPVRTYVKTNSGQEFANKKENERHTNVNFNKFIVVNVHRPQNSGLKLMPINFAKELAAKIKNGEVSAGSVVEY